MQSHLTRRVFRAILNNEPLRSSRCRYRLLHTIPPHRARKLGPPQLNHAQRRGLFAFNMKPQASESRATTLQSEIGLKTMRDLLRSLEDKSRGPTNDVLAKAFQEFFAARADTPGYITGFQGRLLNVTWEHLHAHQQDIESEDWAAVFSTESLESVLFVLSEATCLPASREPILNIAHSVFQELCADHGFGPNEVSRPALIAYVNLMSSNGDPGRAQEVVEKFWDKLQKAKPSPWLEVIRGYAIRGGRAEIKQIPARLKEHGREFDAAFQEELIKVLIEQNLWPAVQALYECPVSGGREEPTFATKEAVIRYALFRSKATWAKPIFQSLTKRSITETIGISLLWETAQGNNAFEISEKAKAWTAGNPAAQASLTTSYLNDLISLANNMGNPQLATEFYALASQWGLVPDSQTKLLQLETCVLAKDIDGALTLMQELPDLGSAAACDHLPLMNKLITMLCWSGQENALFNQVSGLLDPLFENNVRLEPETLAALTHLLLNRRDWEAVSELLRPRLGAFDSEEATVVRGAVTNYILDATKNTDDVWEVYNLLRLAFPDTGVAMRTEIMIAFFERNRSDLACLVFGHMRQAENPGQRPKPFTYALCLQGIARAADAKNLELVHNMLKLDIEVDLNTQVRNGLMLAYACCEMPEKSMKIWREILQSEEGPTHRTIGIFFKACESHHNGVQEAIKMMQKAKDLEIGIDRRMYVSYIVALAAHCEFELATEAIDNMQAETGYKPSRKTLVFTSFSLERGADWKLESVSFTTRYLINTGRTKSRSGRKPIIRNCGIISWS